MRYLIVFFSLSTFGLAQAPRPDAKGCEDPAILSRLTGCWIASCQKKEYNIHNMPIGKPNKFQNVEGAYEWFNFWLEGFAGAEQSKLGFYSPVDSFKKYLTPEQVREWYDGVGRDGGSVANRNAKIFVWNTKPKNQEYYTDKWNEFLAS